MHYEAVFDCQSLFIAPVHYLGNYEGRGCRPVRYCARTKRCTCEWTRLAPSSWLLSCACPAAAVDRFRVCLTSSESLRLTVIKSRGAGCLLKSSTLELKDLQPG